MRKSPPLFIAAGVAIAITLSGCAAGTASSSSSASSDQSLVVATSTGLPTLDKEAFTGTQMSEVMTNLTEPLYRYKPSASKSQGVEVSSPTEYVSGVCKTFTWSTDGKSLDCKLGDEKSQYGNTITAADVKWSFDYDVAAASTTLSLMGTISMDTKNPVTIVNSKEVTLNFTEANATAHAALTFPFFSPVDAAEVKKHVTTADPWGRKYLATHSAGFGPYEVTSFVANQSVEMKINPYYTSQAAGVPLPTYKTVTFKAVTDSTTRAELLNSGAVQVARELDLSMVPLLKTSTTVKTIVFPFDSDNVVFFNTKSAPFTDERVREAVACAIDKKEISTKTYYGLFPVAHTVMSKVPSTDDSYDTCPTQDLAKSKALLAAAGQKNLTLTLEYSRANSGQDAQDNATLIQGMLEKAGITVTTSEEPDGSKYYANIAAHKYDIYLENIGSNVDDPGWQLSSWFTPGAFLNGGNIDTPAITTQLGLLKTLPADSAARTAAAKKVQQLIMSQNLVVPLVAKTNRYVVNKNVCGFQADPGDVTQWQFMKPCAD